jgi:hypothetical protein
MVNLAEDRRFACDPLFLLMAVRTAPLPAFVLRHLFAANLLDGTHVLLLVSLGVVIGGN